ncbi:MAG: hypothetical protein ACXVJN_04900 [Mucilaginibacter sp.]
MKLISKLFLILLAGMALTFSACKKSGSSKTVSPKAVSSQIALNLAQTLYGGLGGFNASGGLTPPTLNSITRKQLAAKRQQLVLKLSNGRQLNSFGDNIACGMSADTTLTYSATLDDGSTASISGSIGYTFLCTNNVASGFNIRANLNISEANSTLSGTYKLAENLTLQSQDPSNENSSYTMGGTLSMSDNVAYKTGSKAVTAASFSYDFTTPLLIDSSGNIDAGVATFATRGTDTSGTWNYSGTVTFLGNNKVTITINGTAYTVDLTTGAVS